MARSERSRGTIRLLRLGALLAVVGVALPSRAQSQSNDPATIKTLQTNPLAALRAFEPATGEAYQIGPGDEISLDFGVRAELNSKRIVGPDGRITLPLAGSVTVSDQTREGAAAAIMAVLQPYYQNLAVTVGVEKYTSNRVLLLGAVEHPGVITFDAPPTLLEVVTRGGVLGGPSAVPGAAKMPVIPDRCVIYRGADKVMWVNLKDLLDSGNPMADLRLRRDDVVYVPSAADRYVSVLGQVQHPGAFQLESTTSLRKLLAEAGGLTDAAGTNANIRVISPSSGTTRIIPMKTLMQPVPLDLTLKSGDVVFVPKSRFNNISYVFEKVSPLISIFTAFAFLEE